MVFYVAPLSFLLLRQNLSEKNAKISQVLLGRLSVVESGIQTHMPEMQREGRIETIDEIEKFVLGDIGEHHLFRWCGSIYTPNAIDHRWNYRAWFDC